MVYSGFAVDCSDNDYDSFQHWSTKKLIKAKKKLDEMKRILESPNVLNFDRYYEEFDYLDWLDITKELYRRGITQ